MIQLRDIANPVIIPEFIRVGEHVNEPPSSVTLADFKSYLGISHDSEDENLSALIVSFCNELAHPTSIGIPPIETTWTMRVPLGGKRVVYLPRYNDANFTTVNYDATGEVISTTWEEAGAEDWLPGIRFLVTEATDLPTSTAFAWSVGYTGTNFPDPVRRLIFMEAAFRREFPLGVGDTGQPLIERPPAVDLKRAEWGMILDLNNYLT